MFAGNIECIDSLIKYGCDVNLRDADGRPTLYILALENNVTIAKHLLENSNINVNLPDNEGRTPLHVSAWQGHLEMVELLLSHGMCHTLATKLCSNCLKFVAKLSIFVVVVVVLI